MVHLYSNLMESDINMMKGLEQVDSQVYKAIKKEEVNNVKVNFDID